MSEVFYVKDLDVSQFDHLPLYEPVSEIEVEGKKYKVIKKTKENSVMIKIMSIFFCTILSILTLGIALAFQSIRQGFTGKTIIELRLDLRLFKAAEILRSGDFKDEGVGHREKTGIFHIDEVQGSKNLRNAARRLSVTDPHIMSPQNLKSVKQENILNYIMIKLKRLGHALSLSHELIKGTDKFSFEGFSEDFTIPQLSSAFLNAEENLKGNGMFRFAGEKLNRSLSNEWCPDNEIEKALNTIHNPESDEIVPIASGFDWHGTFILFFRGHLIHINRGYPSGGGINIYKMPNPKMVTKHLLLSLVQRQNINSATYLNHFSEDALIRNLHLQKIKNIPLKDQKTGNCTYVNVRNGARALMAIFTLLNDKTIKNNLSDVDWAKAFDTITPHYKNFVKFDRSLILDDLFDDVKAGEDFVFFSAQELYRLLKVRKWHEYPLKYSLELNRTDIGRPGVRVI